MLIDILTLVCFTKRLLEQLSNVFDLPTENVNLILPVSNSGGILVNLHIKQLFQQFTHNVTGDITIYEGPRDSGGGTAV